MLVTGTKSIGPKVLYMSYMSMFKLKFITVINHINISYALIE